MADSSLQAGVLNHTLRVNRDYREKLHFQDNDGADVDVSTWDLQASVGDPQSPDWNFTVEKINTGTGGRVDLVASRTDVTTAGTWRWDLVRVLSDKRVTLLEGDVTVKETVTSVI